MAPTGLTMRASPGPMFNPTFGPTPWTSIIHSLIKLGTAILHKQCTVKVAPQVNRVDYTKLAQALLRGHRINFFQPFKRRAMPSCVMENTSPSQPKTDTQFIPGRSKETERPEPILDKSMRSQVPKSNPPAANERPRLPWGHSWEVHQAPWPPSSRASLMVWRTVQPKRFTLTDGALDWHPCGQHVNPSSLPFAPVRSTLKWGTTDTPCKALGQAKFCKA